MPRDLVSPDGLFDVSFRQFMRHFYALFIKRLHYFKRDAKGLCFLILIPIIVTLAAVLVVKVRGGSGVASRRSRVVVVHSCGLTGDCVCVCWG